MARVELPDGEGWERTRMWQLHPHFGEALEHFSRVVQERTILPLSVHEAARMRMADINKCVACQSARPADREAHGLTEEFYAAVSDPARRGDFTEAQQLAIEFAERFSVGVAAFDDPFWVRVHAVFDDAEIVDLTTSCAKWLGFGRINAVLELVPDCELEVAAQLSTPTR